MEANMVWKRVWIGIAVILTQTIPIGAALVTLVR
jgi:hypothetical protein